MTDPSQQGHEWQVELWNRMADIYIREIDPRFEPVVEGVLSRAALSPGQRVLDLGTGTGSVAHRAAEQVGPGGSVLAVDVSAEMLAVARRRSDALGGADVEFTLGRAEMIPAEDDAFDAVVASLSLMYVIDRAAAAREIKRVLKPDGILVGAVWAGPDECDIVLFQGTAGSFAGLPPVPGVGPGALADPSPFLGQLADAGIVATVEREVLGFDFPDFASAWDALALVTTSDLPEAMKHDAMRATAAAMDWKDAAPRRFSNTTQFIIGRPDEPEG